MFDSNHHQIKKINDSFKKFTYTGGWR